MDEKRREPIVISFRRRSVCMGDDAGNGEYTIKMPGDATVGELLKVALRGGYGNDWPIPYTGALSYWVIQSNVGDLGRIYTGADGEWRIECKVDGGTRLKEIGVKWIFGERE